MGRIVTSHWLLWEHHGSFTNSTSVRHKIIHSFIHSSFLPFILSFINSSIHSFTCSEFNLHLTFIFQLFFYLFIYVTFAIWSFLIFCESFSQGAFGHLPSCLIWYDLNSLSNFLILISSIVIHHSYTVTCNSFIFLIKYIIHKINVFNYWFTTLSFKFKNLYNSFLHFLKSCGRRCFDLQNRVPQQKKNAVFSLVSCDRLDYDIRSLSYKEKYLLEWVYPSFIRVRPLTSILVTPTKNIQWFFQYISATWLRQVIFLSEL